MERVRNDLDRALALDAEDELGGLRAEFHVPEENGAPLVYLSGHSLGLMPRAARGAVEKELDAWARLAVEAHFDREVDWYAYHERFAAPLAGLVGAAPDEVVAMSSLTTNLHLMLVSFFRPGGGRDKIVIERGAFASDRYAVQSQLRCHGLDRDRSLVEIGLPEGPARIDPDDLDRALSEHPGQVALVLLPGVQFLTGQVLDLAAFSTVARAHGCRIGFDLAHAIGNVPLAAHDAGVDFAVWCSYKYLNAGPGAVGGCFVHDRWNRTVDLPRLEGWWGHSAATRLRMERAFDPLPGAQAWQLSNPPILALAPLAASLALFERATLAKLRAKSARLTALLEHALERACSDRIELVTSSDPDQRGCQLTVRVKGRAPDAVAAALRRAGVVADWRADLLRLAPAPLYNSFRDVVVAAEALGRALGPR